MNKENTIEVPADKVIDVLLHGRQLESHYATQESVDALKETVNIRFEQVDKRFEQIDKRFDDVNSKIDDNFKTLDSKIDLKFNLILGFFFTNVAALVGAAVWIASKLG